MQDKNKDAAEYEQKDGACDKTEVLDSYDSCPAVHDRYTVISNPSLAR